MVDRTNDFAAQGAFGAESDLAAQYTDKYLGDASVSRGWKPVPGILAGNLVGSRDRKRRRRPALFHGEI